MRRGELLAEVVRDRKLVAVCGSHGKTTTTAMLITALRAANFPAGYVLGGLFADDTPRTVDIPFTSFAPIGVTSDATPPLDKAAFLLFVVDTLNALPGTSGRLLISEVGFVR